MAEQDHTIARLVEALKEPVRIDPSFDRRVISAIERLQPRAARTSAVGSLAIWLRRRRTIRLSPLRGLAMAAGLAAVVVGGVWLARPHPQQSSVDPQPTPFDALGAPEWTQLTQFVLVAPSARSVAVVGDFNDWNLAATPLKRAAGDGMWWITVPLSPGRYRYAFVVDGTIWRGDPDAPAAEDEFGRPSSVVSIGGA